MSKAKRKLENAELYRKAYLEWYPQWSEAKHRAQVARVRKMSSAERFAEYASLLAFAREIGAQEHPRLRAQRWQDWDEYYARIQIFEAKRHAANGNSRRSSPRRHRRT